MFSAYDSEELKESGWGIFGCDGTCGQDPLATLSSLLASWGVLCPKSTARAAPAQVPAPHVYTGSRAVRSR